MEEQFPSLCEELFTAWLLGSGHPSKAAAGTFTLEHCPEPYLCFGPQTRPLIFLSTNPGGGLAEQRRPGESAQSLLVGAADYREASRRLAIHYEHPATRLGTAKANIRAMRRYAELLGFSGVQQVEAIPWHSPQLSNKRRTLELLREQDRDYRRYERALRAYIEVQPTVLSWAAGVPALKGGDGVEMKASLLGIDLARCQLLWVSEEKRSQALLWQRSGERVRGIFVTQGNAILPTLSKDSNPLRAQRIRSVLAGGSGDTDRDLWESR